MASLSRITALIDYLLIAPLSEPSVIMFRIAITLSLFPSDGFVFNKHFEKG